MGIQDGTRIKELLRRERCVLEKEKAMQGLSRTYLESRYWIIDCMLDIYTKPPHVKTGSQLVYWYFSTRILPALLHNKTLVLIFDDCRRTPQNKAACQQKRRARVSALPDGLFVSDAGELPEWYPLLGSGKYRAMVFEYLLMGLAGRVESVTAPHNGVVFVHRPYAKHSFYDTQWMNGGVVELTNTQSPRLANPIAHGEGDMLCRLWSDFFASQNPFAKIVIRSKDLDMAGIYSARAPRGDCHLHITTIQPHRNKAEKTVQFEFLRVRNLHSTLLPTQEKALTFTYALILAGSDFCEGVRGVAGRNIVSQALAMPTEDSVIVVDKTTNKTSLQEAAAEINYGIVPQKASVGLRANVHVP